jgi:hypothetical protein
MAVACTSENTRVLVPTLRASRSGLLFRTNDSERSDLRAQREKLLGGAEFVTGIVLF